MRIRPAYEQFTLRKGYFCTEIGKYLSVCNIDLIMNFNKTILLIFASCLVLLISCKDEIEEPNIDFGFEYFPMEQGKWVVYEADSIIYNDFEEVVETTYLQIREFIEEEFVDNEGRPAVRVERSYRYDPNDNWNLQDIWYGVRDSSTAERIEENVRFLKIAFPPTNGKQWKGNTYIDNTDPELEIYKDDWDYTVLSTDATYANGSVNLSNVLEIQQNDFETFIEKSFSKEMYAKGIGLVYKEFWNLETQTIDPNCPWVECAEKGFIYRQRLIDHN